MDLSDNDTEKIYKGSSEIYEILLQRFKEYQKENADDSSPDVVNYLTKLSCSLAYPGQVHSGLAKAYHQEKRLNELEKRIENISPEKLEKFRKRLKA